MTDPTTDKPAACQQLSPHWAIGYTIIPSYILTDERLDPYDRNILLIIHSFKNYNRPKPLSRSYLHKVSGIAESKIQKIIEKLVALDLVEIIRGDRKTPHKITSKVDLLEVKGRPQITSKVDLQEVKGRPPGGHKELNIKLNNKEEEGGETECSRINNVLRIKNKNKEEEGGEPEGSGGTPPPLPLVLPDQATTLENPITGEEVKKKRGLKEELTQEDTEHDFNERLCDLFQKKILDARLNNRRKYPMDSYAREDIESKIKAIIKKNKHAKEEIYSLEKWERVFNYYVHRAETHDSISEFSWISHWSKVTLGFFLQKQKTSQVVQFFDLLQKADDEDARRLEFEERSARYN